MTEIDKIPSASISGDAKIKISENETISAKDLKCSFSSDFDIKDIPTNFAEAISSYKSLVNLTDENTDNVLEFELDPIDQYCDGTTAILMSLHDEVQNQVKTQIS